VRGDDGGNGFRRVRPHGEQNSSEQRLPGIKQAMCHCAQWLVGPSSKDRYIISAI
jgi:hypothetical protein